MNNEEVVVLLKKSLTVLLAIGMGVSVLATPTVALATTPTGEFSVFAQCPYTSAGVNGCVYAQTESGEFVAGKRRVPITKTITLQGGTTRNAEGFLEFVAPTSGETLSKTPQNVPGGLANIVNCTEISFYLARIACEAVFEKGVTEVTATTELAGPPSSVVLDTPALLGEKGTALKMPVKVHLQNSFLGSECYIGSNSEPIVLELTTGTTSPPAPNKPIKGAAGEEKFTEEGNLLTISKNSLVNNSFAAPGANGCGGILSFIIDPVVDSAMGLPAAGGQNTAILNGTLKSASAEAVEEHA